MFNNRLFAAGFRLFAAGVIIYGVVVGSGIVGGPVKLLSYTAQSNILCAAYFLYAGFRSLLEVFTKGVRGSACYLPRLSSGILVTILFTAVIFWCALAPFAGKQNFLSAGNLILHTFSALFVFLDRVLFFQHGLIRKKDVWLFALIPSVYVLQSIVLGACGVVFYVKDGINYYFPYLFMDFNVLGWRAAVCVCAIAAAFIGVCLLLVLIDGRRFARMEKRRGTNEASSGTQGVV